MKKRPLPPMGKNLQLVSRGGPVKAENKKVVVAVIDGELTVKRLLLQNKTIKLVPENPNYPTIKITEDQAFQIWGVVTNVVHRL